jgi:hypothetical protein
MTSVGPRTPWRTQLVVVLLILAAGLPAWAQDAGQSGSPDAQPIEPKTESRTVSPGADDPPPLNLGGTRSGPAEPTPPDPGGKPWSGRWLAYAKAFHSSLQKALKANAKTRGAPFEMDAEVWVDSKGHVTQVRLIGSSGNAEIDSALRSEIFPGLVLPEPSKDMPMPIRAHMRR